MTKGNTQPNRSIECCILKFFGMKMNDFPWEPLDYTKIPEVTPCGICDKPMYLLKVNKHVCFWVHKGEDIRKCKAPIAFKTSFTHGMKEWLKAKEEGLKKQIEKGRVRKNKKKRVRKGNPQSTV